MRKKPFRFPHGIIGEIKGQLTSQQRKAIETHARHLANGEILRVIEGYGELRRTPEGYVLGQSAMAERVRRKDRGAWKE